MKVLAVLLVVALVAATPTLAGRRRRRRRNNQERGLTNTSDNDYEWSCAGEDLGHYLQKSSEHTLLLQSCARLPRRTLHCLLNMASLPANIAIEARCHKKRGWKKAHLRGAPSGSRKLDATSAHIKIEGGGGSEVVSAWQMQRALAAAINDAVGRVVVQDTEVLIHGISEGDPFDVTVTLAVPRRDKTAASCGLQTVVQDDDANALLTSMSTYSSGFNSTTANATLESIVFCSSCHPSHC